VVHSFPASKATITTIDGLYPCSPHSDSSSYITEASRLTEKLTTADVHEYFLSGAMIYIGLQKWQEALQYLECVLLSPASGTASGLMLEAYQKWVLVGCLAAGRVSAKCRDMRNAGFGVYTDRRTQAPELPKGVHGGVIRTLKACSKAYDAVAEIFGQGDPRRLQAEIAAGSNVWFEVR
jgi:COP9 signalosome complex subunit 3